jgi:peptidoglycan/xylan/chitin deacetylase (PgdA/CDA1 family)/mannose-6-phosphate isomerase-like protein (cupin superfamily)
MDGPVSDFVGYGRNAADIRWPNDARLAVSLVVNYEEGSERSFGLGDTDQESLTEWGAYPFPKDVRNLAMETMYEYGSRVGVWRIMDVLDRQAVKATFFACAVAFERNEELARAVVAAGHEVCSHGYRWEETFRLSRDDERTHIRLAIESFERTCGVRPVGWYCRYGPSVSTRELIVEEGGFIYDSDAYNDDVPYFVNVRGKRHLVVPYTADVNDIQMWLAQPLTTSDQFFQYLKDSFDVLYHEAYARPRLMSVGLHCRIIGRPGRIGALEKFIEYAKAIPEVWIATRSEIAQWWIAQSSDSDKLMAGQPSGLLSPQSRRVEKKSLSEIESAGSGGAGWRKTLVSSAVFENAKSTVCYGFFPVGSESQRIAHVEDEWMLVVRGCGELRLEDGSIGFDEGDVLYIRANTWHGVINLGSIDMITVFGFVTPSYPMTRSFPANR